MKKKITLAIIIMLMLCSVLSGCTAEKDGGLDSKKPVTLTMWHNYGGAMQKTMDELIDEFNVTVGKEKGIIINVTDISSSADLRQKLDMIVNDDPGAPELPDIFSCYPRTAINFQSKGMIANLDNYFSKKELSDYVPKFIEEGRFADNGLYVFPFAKSTEILYVNQTLFDRFAAENDVSIDDFKTFDGIANMATKYYAWTDSKTPDIKNDGKSFFIADSWLNVAQAGMQQQGTELFQNERLFFNNNEFSKIFNTLYPAFLSGGFAVYDGYSSDLSKTGEIVCSTGSSAGILFYGDTITYPDNTVEKVEYSILPFPTFDGGEKYAIQRGNGFCVASSDKTREYAAACFLKWFTQPEQNLRFIFSTGYLPVTNEAFGTRMEEQIKTIESPYIKKMLTAVTQMYKEYTFFVAPTFESFDTIGKQYETTFKKMVSEDRQTQIDAGNSEIKVLEDAFHRFLAENAK